MWHILVTLLSSGLLHAFGVWCSGSLHRPHLPCAMVWKLVHADRDSHHLHTFGTSFISNFRQTLVLLRPLYDIVSSHPLIALHTFLPFHHFSCASGVTVMSFSLSVLLLDSVSPFSVFLLSQRDSIVFGCLPELYYIAKLVVLYI